MAAKAQEAVGVVDAELELASLLTGGAAMDVITEELELTDAEKQEFADVGIRGKTTTTRARRVRLYNPHGAYGWVPAIISTNAIKQCLEAGWKAACGDCGRNDCSVMPDGKLTADPNACTGKPRTKRARCPVCQKPIADFGGSIPAPSGTPSEDEIELEGFATLTPELRIQARLIEHMLAFHPSESRAFPAVAAARMQQAAAQTGVVA